MALFDKLFSLKRRLDSDKCERKRDRSCQINQEQVRLLLFKECDWRGRRLLFDSSAIQKVPAAKNDKTNLKQTDKVPCILEITDGFSYMYKGPEADATVLGEMIFGAVAINCKSVSLKIHIMDEPRRVMCTKVFCVPASRYKSRVERKTSDRTHTSDVESNSSKINVPSFKEDGVALSFSIDRGDSGFCGDLSPYSSVSSTNDYFSMFDSWDGNSSQEDFYSFHSLPGRKLSTSSNGSWQRRTFQNIATRFELGQSSNLLNVPTSSDSQLYSNSSASGTSDSIASGSSLPQRKNKLGLAVLITVTDSTQFDLVRKYMEHSPQMQALVCRLRLATLSAGSGSGFVSTLYRAAEDAARWLSDLINGPRLQPLWLTMVTSGPRTSNKLADSLLSDLCSVLTVGDTKTTNFFISTLLTHVLTYHLGWVTTVSPYDTVDHPKTQKSPNINRPYNVLWAQLNDLCGSIGFPPRAAKTIIIGERNVQFINRLLLILTYFLRCGEVKRTDFAYRDALHETRTISVSKTQNVGLKRTATRLNKLDDSLTVPSVNEQSSHSSVSTLVASDTSLKKTSTLANLSEKLSSSECGSSGCQKLTGPLRRNPTMMVSLKASSDSSPNSSVSEESEAEQKVLFVLGDDEKLVGLKNKSANGKSGKRSSTIQHEPVELQEKECNKQGFNERNSESPSKCCGQTLQHSKPIKHSGIKFEFDKYPQIVTNYMKSKNLEILNRHYIGKPGNLKLGNFQFDPLIILPIQEEKCDICEKCQIMESMLQTPTNASEMEYMNDMPRHSEPQYAKETVVTDTAINHREMSPKTFVRRRKENTVVVNLLKNITATKQVETLTTPLTNATLSEEVTPNEPPTIAIENTLELSDKPQVTIARNKLRPTLRPSKLKLTISTNNLSQLMNLDDETSKSTKEFQSRFQSDDTILKELDENSPEFKADKLDDRITENSILCVKEIEKVTSLIEPITSFVELNLPTTTINSTVTTDVSNTQKKSSIEESSREQTNKPECILTPVESDSIKEMPSLISRPSLLDSKRLEARRSCKEPEKTVEVQKVIEFDFPKMDADSSKSQSSGFDTSLLGGITDHYVPDLVLQGTIARPNCWEAELRRDLDITSYLNKQLELPVQALAIIGDTNTWEVRVVGRDGGSNGMSSLVGAMLDAIPAMWRARVPAHQCLSFLEGKLREFCVLSKTLADMLMSTDFCDIATLTKSLNIDVNDVPLLLAVATTHTPQVAARYGISYR